MKLHRLLLGVGIVFGLAALAVVGRDAEPTPARMAAAAEKFLALLTADQKAKAAFPFDSKERFNWNFVPLQDKDKQPTRKGVRLEELTDAQKKAALELLATGTSQAGFDKATTIMSLESILHEQEKARPNNVRSPGWYFVTIFGTPSKTGAWGWRWEGHHLSLSYTLDGGKVVAATPAVFGSNPAEIKAGDKKGHRPLGDAEDAAVALYDSLTDEQRKVAVQAKQFPEIEQKVTKPGVGEPVGLPAAKMTAAQKETLKKLLAAYTGRMPADVAAEQMDAVNKAGLEKVHFGFAREAEKPGKPYTYRVQGPTFVVEFLNVQADAGGNPANHIHSSWRNVAGDFGTAK